MSLKDEEARKKYYKEYYQKNKEKLGAKTKAWRKNKETLYRVSNIKHRCKKEGIPFDLDHNDIVIPDRCPILGIEFKRGNGRPEDSSPSIDRIDPNGGYVRGNIQVISNLANKMKANATPEQLLLFAKWVLNTYG